MLRSVLHLFAALAVLGGLWPALAAAEGAVVVMYHRFGDDRYPTTNIRLQQFEAHLSELKSGKYAILPLPEIIRRLRHGDALPDRTVGITVDDAFLTVYENAWPRFRDAGIPFTLFASTEPIDQGKPDYMTWDQVREMVEGGVTIGHHSAAHLSFVRIGPQGVEEQIRKASARLKTELGQVPEIIAYPYGEVGAAEQAIVKDAGFAAAFGQHSGAFDTSADFLYLPRFAFNETLGNIKRFKLAVNTLPLPVTDLTPADPRIGVENPLLLGFTVMEGIKNLGAINCFASHEGKVETIRLGESRIEVRLTKPLPRGRSRVNCTLPAGGGRWRWFGRQFFVGD